MQSKDDSFKLKWESGWEEDNDCDIEKTLDDGEWQEFDEVSDPEEELDNNLNFEGVFSCREICSWATFELTISINN